MKIGERVEINMPKSYEKQFPTYYKSFLGKKGKVHHVLDLQGLLHWDGKGDRYTVSVTLESKDKHPPIVYFPISCCRRIQ